MTKSHPDNFRAAESSQTTRPRYLYLIEYQSQIYHICDHDVVLSVTGLPASKGNDPQDFTPAAVQHGDPEQSMDIGANRIEMAIGINDSSLSDQVRENLLFNVPAKMTVTIVRANPEVSTNTLVWGEDTFVIFKGVATNLVFEAGQIGISLVSLIMQTDGRIPRFYYQKTCQHALYGELCGADPTAANARLDTVAAAIDARQRYVDIENTQIGSLVIEEHTFKGGKLIEFESPDLEDESSVAFTTEVGRIAILNSQLISGGGVRLYLGWWSRTMAAGRSIRLQRGCRRITDDCASFDNIANFGGHPWIPHFSPSLQGIR